MLQQEARKEGRKREMLLLLWKPGSTAQMEDATEQTRTQHQGEQAYLLQLSTGTINKAWKRLGYWWTIQISLIFFFFRVLKNTEWKQKDHSLCCHHVLHRKLASLPAAPQELHGKMLRSLLFLVCFHERRQCWGNLPKMELNVLPFFCFVSPSEMRGSVRQCSLPSPGKSHCQPHCVQLSSTALILPCTEPQLLGN